VANYAAALLVLIILNGFLGIFIYLRAKVPTHAKRARYLLRGILSIILGAITLSLLRAQVINSWTALLSVSFLLMLSEYLLAAKEKRQLVREGLYDPAELEQRERKAWQKVKSKGQWRYVFEHVIGYGIVGFILVAALNLRMPESFPLYMWIAGGLFAALCGAAAALEKWKRQRS
jgi:uncharacterized membrane protein YfcA